MLRDPEYRSTHKLLLSREDLEIVEPNCAAKEPDGSLFPTVDARKTLAWIDTQARTAVQGHGLRAMFASIAEELASSGVLKRMMNQAGST